LRHVYFLLNLSLRILPHHQDTGGFFIAVLHKKKSQKSDVVKTEGENDAKSVPPEPYGSGMKSAPAKRLKHVFKENPFNFFDDENKPDGWSSIQ
jgi:hypothetical protein